MPGVTQNTSKVNVLMPYNGCVMPRIINNWLQCLAGEEIKQAVIDRMNLKS